MVLKSCQLLIIFPGGHQLVYFERQAKNYQKLIKNFVQDPTF